MICIDFKSIEDYVHQNKVKKSRKTTLTQFKIYGLICKLNLNRQQLRKKLIRKTTTSKYNFNTKKL